MKCNIFDFFVDDQCKEHNFDIYVDFMLAELTTMTLYLQFPRLSKSIDCWKDIFDPIMDLRYLWMSQCLQ